MRSVLFLDDGITVSKNDCYVCPGNPYAAAAADAARVGSSTASRVAAAEAAEACLQSMVSHATNV